ncbi:MG2 domain-containing protein [Archangium lansingense]|uniref:MG2 domain-containing protein n=1 Tax=Archangium lansingense TaxID=2995310 RepID=A0ABT3ZXL3_9BACT|nr:MG2 domain-containing protein [Archangium lansinium]MCY1074131.1 MG2 domain-containing protein [Archangium lansinium]
MNIRFNRRGALGITAVLALGLVWWATSDVCVSAWVFQGVKVNRCPDGNFRQTVGLRVDGLAREVTGAVQVSALAHGVTENAGERLSAPVRRLEASLFLVDSEGKESPLALETPLEQEDYDFILRARVKLPALPDGDYKLRARVTTPLGTGTEEVPLALYAPARVHVLTDRPLYEPGHQVRFRALVLRAKDLSPIDGRPGTWFVTDPSGEVVLEQRMPAGPWGVVAGDFPLDRGAPTGRWTARWTSGDVSGEASFQVKPFTLPRFRVEALSTRPFWRVGESPIVEGRVVYSSGAPVADAAVDVSWNVSGEWPAPLEWLDAKAKDGLPRKARTDASGRFRLALPRVPYDLRGQATLSAWLSATDPAGDQVQGGASVLLAEDALSVSTVTELSDGLVEGYSNRVYLRATTADGQVLPGTELTVKRAWDPRDEGVSAVTDEDGVAAFQLDPGPPVNVVIPPMPVRRQPPPPPVGLSSVRDLLSDTHSPALEDQLALERWLESLHPCARFVPPEEGSIQVTLGLRVAAGGSVVDVMSEGSPLAACLASVVRARSLPPGRERMLVLTLNVFDPGLPSFYFQVLDVSGASEGLREALALAALDARDCLPGALSLPAPLPAALTWRTRPKQREVEVGWSSLPQVQGMLPAAHLSCIQSRFSRLVLRAEPESAMGVVRFTASPASGGSESEVAQATTLLGYELRVSAKAGKEELGSTKLVLSPAGLPRARLRATPVLARAGDEVRMELLRGPDFHGELPKELVLRAGEKELKEKVENKAVRFRLPEDFEGWAEATWEGAVARVYVAPRAQLALEVTPDKTAYAPGELAHLQVHTRVDGKDGPAAVGLFGVDESLSQLVPLPGTGALDDLRPAPTVSSPAFDVLDGTALAMGRIRGANAAAATLLRVSGVPQRDGGERRVSLSVSKPFEPEVELTEPFYRVLSELAVQARAWEESAPQGETLSPAGMAKLWEKALEACEKRGEAVTDAFGRRLKLSRLPPELLALTDPRAVVVNGTRLPEDVENWGAWVAREAP